MADKTKHTSEPWIEDFNDKITSLINDQTVAEIYGASENEKAANMKLFLAAPKLLEALKSVSELMDSGDLVRNISKDEDIMHFMSQGVRINNAIVLMNEAIKKATS